MCVGAIVVEDGRLLLVRRGRPPAAGEWSVPGGRVEWGESMAAAVVREVREETGLDVDCGELVGWVERISDAHHHVIFDFTARTRGARREPRPGDDAAEVAWVDTGLLDDVGLVGGLREFLRDHGVA